MWRTRDTRCTQFPLCLCKNPTSFGSCKTRQISVRSKQYANHSQTAQHKFAVSHLVSEPFANRLVPLCAPGLMHYRIQALRWNSDRWHYKSIRRRWAPVLGQPLLISSNILPNMLKISWKFFRFSLEFPVISSKSPRYNFLKFCSKYTQIR